MTVDIVFERARLQQALLDLRKVQYLYGGEWAPQAHIQNSLLICCAL